MKERLLGRTGLRISEIGFGCWAIGGGSYGKVRDEDSWEALETAWDFGVNFFDTADIYGEGHSEVLIGEFLKGKPRDRITVATKAGWDFYPANAKPASSPKESSSHLNHTSHKKNFDPTYIRFACEQSLRRLGVEAIDLYQLHNPSLELIRGKEIVGVLEKLKKEGKIRFIGISVHTEAEALAALEDSRVEALQVIFNLLDQRMAKKVFPEALKKGVGIIAREPLASGLLSGKYGPEHEFPKDDHRRRWVREKREVDWQKIQRVQQELGRGTSSLPQAALEFILSFEAVSTVIPGAKTKAQVVENVAASLKPSLDREAVSRWESLYTHEEIFQKGLNPR
jgi:aryl-alcohol dehydrogenase-like predicted oxidoreductase